MKTCYIKKMMFIVIGFFVLSMAYAGTSVWTLTPLTATNISVFQNSVSTVKYLVTNQSRKPHTLVMTPIPAITQDVSGSNCPASFELGYQQSCTLVLNIYGSALNGDVTGGPIVCEKASSFECYQPSQSNQLRISLNTQTFTVTPGGDGHETITPNAPQILGYGETTAFTVTANTNYAINTAVGGTCPAGSWSGSTYTTGAITQDCSVNFSATLLNIISISGSPLLLTPNTTGSLTVTNSGPAVAHDVMATLPPDLAVDITQDASNCTTVAVGASCHLHFTSNNQSHPLTNISVSGTNTNGVSAIITLTLPYVANGTVSAMVLDSTNHLIYLGGSFTMVGPNTGFGVPVDTSSGLPATHFPHVNGSVRAVEADGSGGWYIGGTFTNVGGQTRNRVAHILFDGTLDPTWNPNASSTVNSLALSGSTVYAGGSFTSIGGQTRNRIAALDASTGLATAWDPNVNNVVNTLALSGSTIYAGGSFTSIGGQTRNRIAALDASTGLVTAWNPNANASVNSLVLSDSTVYVGGIFVLLNNLPSSAFAVIPMELTP